MFNYQTDRETIEWSNTWIENAGSFTSKRILIIGDSVARNFHGNISKLKIKELRKKLQNTSISQLIELKKIDELDFYKTKKYFGIFKIRN